MIWGIGRFRPRLVPTLVTLVVALGCTGLGLWQLERLEWKRGLIAQREAALAAPATAAPSTRAAASALEFRRVFASGVFLDEKEVLLHAIGPKGEAGFNVLTPLRQTGGSVIFVKRGFVSSAKRLSHNFGTIRVEGLLRLAPDAKPSWFTPDNRPRADDWYWIDLPALGAAAALSEVAPYYIDVGNTLAAVRNDHLQYAITWFLLAAIAIAIYLLAERGAARSNDER